MECVALDKESLTIERLLLREGMSLVDVAGMVEKVLFGLELCFTRRPRTLGALSPRGRTFGMGFIVSSEQGQSKILSSIGHLLTKMGRDGLSIIKRAPTKVATFNPTCKYKKKSIEDS